jgi:hypothetical protein
MKTKTQTDVRRETFSHHAQIARELANTALADIDEVLGDRLLTDGRETQLGQPDMVQVHPNRFRFDLGVIDTVLSSSGLQL